MIACECQGVCLYGGSIGMYHSSATEKTEKELDFLNLTNEINELQCLALCFYDKYPWQNIRALRAFVPLKDQREVPLSERLKGKQIPEETCAELESLHNAINHKIAEISSMASADHLECSSNPLSLDLEKILTAGNFLEIILWAYERSNPSPTAVKFSLPYNITYNAPVDPQHVALIEAVKLFKGHTLKFKGASTSIPEREMANSRFARLALGLYPSKEESREWFAYDFYLDVYNVDEDLVVPGLAPLESKLQTLFPGKVALPFRIWLPDCSASPGSSNRRRIEIGCYFSTRFVDLHQHRKIFQYMVEHNDTYRKAARLLHTSHPDVRYVNHLTQLYDNTFGELFWAKLSEDIWQDVGAAVKYDAPNKEAFLRVRDAYEQKGAAFGLYFEGQVYPLPWNLLCNFVPLESQALGPNQIVMGPFFEAAEYQNGQLWAKYFPTRPFPPDKESREALAVEIVLDADQSVFAMAMVFDYFFAQIKSTVMKDPSATFPSNVYPTIRDPKDAHNYHLYNLCGFFDAWIEAAESFPNYFAYGTNTWNLNYTESYFPLLQEIMGIEAGFPSLEMRFYPNKEVTKHDYMGPILDLTEESSFFVVLTPR